jgi:hypothetical protein
MPYKLGWRWKLRQEQGRMSCEELDKFAASLGLDWKLVAHGGYWMLLRKNVVFIDMAKSLKHDCLFLNATFNTTEAAVTICRKKNAFPFF